MATVTERKSGSFCRLSSIALRRERLGLSIIPVRTENSILAMKSPFSENQESEGWMTLTEAAEFLSLSSRTVRLAVERGEIKGEHPLADGPWVFRLPFVRQKNGGAGYDRRRHLEASFHPGITAAERSHISAQR
jgi:hypothetical protein